MAQTTKHHKSGVDNQVLKNLFKRGLAIYAWASKDGVRIVTIEDLASLYYDHATEPAYRIAAKQLAVGQSHHVEHALNQAVAICHGAIVTGKVVHNLEEAAAQPPQPLASELDYWLVEHGGTMRVVQDEDGSILCLLEGLRQPTSLPHERVALEGTGASFTTALKDALRQLKKSEVALETLATQLTSV